MPGQKSLRLKEGFMLANSLRTQSIMQETAWRQELEAAGHSMITIGEHRDEGWGSAHIFIQARTPAFGVALPRLMVEFSSSVKSLLKHPHQLCLLYNPQPLKLTIKIYCYIIFILYSRNQRESYFSYFL